MLSDVLLVHQTLSGDDAAFYRLMKKYETDIYTFILPWVKNEADAEELTQDVFWKAYQNLYSLRQPSRFYPWLIKIAKNQCHDWKRKKHDSFPSMQETDFSSEIPPLEELVILREAISKVLEVVETLPEVEKKLLKERYLEDVSYKDLQTRHGLSYKGVAMRLFKAKRKVREKVLKMLSSMVAFPWRDVMEKLFLGGIEAVKVSATTKLVTVWTATLLILGGITVSVWHTKSPKQFMSKQVVTQAAQKTPPKSLGYSFSKQKSSVTPVQKPTVSPPVTGSVEGKEPMDDADWEALLAELGGNEQTVAPVTNEKGTSEKKSDDSSKSEQWEAEVEEVKMQVMQAISERAYVINELKRLGNIPNPDPVLVSKYIEDRGKMGYQKIWPLIARYIRLTGDMAAIEPGGWIYEYGHTTGGFLIRKADPEAARFGDESIRRK